MGNVWVRMRVSEEERAGLKARALGAGLTLSTYLRTLVLPEKASGTKAPPKALGAGTSRRHNVTMTDTEWAALRMLADGAGISVSEYVRLRCLDPTFRVTLVDTDELQAVHYELYKQGVNLNQIARRLNALSDDELPEHSGEALAELDEHIRAVSETVKDVRAILRGRKVRRKHG